MDPWNFVIKYKDGLMGLCKGDEELFSDVVLVKIHSILGNYEPSKGSLWNYVKGSLRWEIHKYRCRYDPKWRRLRNQVPLDSVDRAMPSSGNETVSCLMESLNETEKYLLYLRFWEDRTYEEMGEILGLGRKVVSKMLDEILRNANEIIKRETP